MVTKNISVKLAINRLSGLEINEAMSDTHKKTVFNGIDHLTIV